jgi:hypothetical protein
MSNDIYTRLFKKTIQNDEEKELTIDSKEPFLMSKFG